MRLQNTENMWGKAGGDDPQRTDLWQIDLTAVVNGLFEASTVRLPAPPRYFTASVDLPEQKVSAEKVMRDSKAYYMPSWDDALAPIRITFYVDDGGRMSHDSEFVAGSLIYQIMDLWRKVVRGGRGSLGSESSLLLSNVTYNIKYAYPIRIYLLKGYGLPPRSLTVSNRLPPTASPFDGFQAVQLGGVDEKIMIQDTNNEEAITRSSITEQLASSGELFTSQMEAGLYVSGIYDLERAWLSSFKLGQLSYQGAQVLTLETQLYADNLSFTTTSPTVQKTYASIPS